jgi:hypothetical protein
MIRGEMLGVTQRTVPEDSLLRTYVGGRHPQAWREYHDCFEIETDRPVTLADFVFAFYTSPIFRLERIILRLLAGTPSRDAEARAVAEGSGSSFAVWTVGERTQAQLLMCDRYSKTRSWFCVVPSGQGTLLRFGSGIVAVADPRTGRKRMGPGFHALLGFHVFYSRLLLYFARRGVIRALKRS